MGHRLSKIYTRTGDQGTTGLADGTRVSKFDLRVAAMGTLDEANPAVGFLLAQSFDSAQIRATLIEIQHRLFDAGAELSMPEHEFILDEHVKALETALDALNEHLPPLREFVLPGGNAAAAAANTVRSR